MKNKIARVLLVFGLFQSGFITIVYKVFDINRNSFFSFLMFTLLWHLVIYFFLISHIEDFCNTGTGERLKKLNLANMITLFRGSSVSTAGFFIRHADVQGIKIIAFVYLALVFLTDSFDGYIARTKKQTTKIGQMLDSMGDYSLLFVISMLYLEKNILSPWFFILIFFRLSIQSIGAIFFINIDYPIKPKSTIGGKITIASTMLLYTLIMFGLFFNNLKSLQRVIGICEIICGVLIFVFLFEKLGLFFNHWKSYQKHKKSLTDDA
ncbi:MAG: CDP-alcohol phosphatidyltransferase [Treponema sp.]|nr:MAG: CDP-alcohol phosphatidyltransferase [Treponema sp.]